VDGVWLGNVVSRREGLVVPAVAKRDGEQRVFRPNDVLTRGHYRALGDGVFAIDDAYVARFGAGTTNQQGTQDKASHQALKAGYTHTLRNDCETHPPLPLWWLKNVDCRVTARNVTSITGRAGFTRDDATHTFAT
jgi:hypothetical protein